MCDTGAAAAAIFAAMSWLQGCRTASQQQAVQQQQAAESARGECTPLTHYPCLTASQPTSLYAGCMPVCCLISLHRCTSLAGAAGCTADAHTVGTLQSSPCHSTLCVCVSVACALPCALPCAFAARQARSAVEDPCCAAVLGPGSSWRLLWLQAVRGAQGQEGRQGQQQTRGSKEVRRGQLCLQGTPPPAAASCSTAGCVGAVVQESKRACTAHAVACMGDHCSTCCGAVAGVVTLTQLSGVRRGWGCAWVMLGAQQYTTFAGGGWGWGG